MLRKLSHYGTGVRIALFQGKFLENKKSPASKRDSNRMEGRSLRGAFAGPSGRLYGQERMSVPLKHGFTGRQPKRQRCSRGQQAVAAAASSVSSVSLPQQSLGVLEG